MPIIREISVTPTVTAGAYSSGYSVGAKQTLNGVTFLTQGGTGYIQSVKMTDKAKQNAITVVTFFNADPTGSTLTDRGALNIVAADLSKIIGTITINNFTTYSATSVGVATGQMIDFSLATGTIYAVAMTLGTPTYASTSDLTFTYGIEQN
jgi:hypothetical protein